MIWFGGISHVLERNAFHVTLKLEFDSEGDNKVKSGILIVKRMQNTDGKLVSLKQADRFFYNQEFYLQEPTKNMISMGLGYTGRYTSRFFDKNRYIGVVGREAFHVFDLLKMDFIYADPGSGYKVNIDPRVYHL